MCNPGPKGWLGGRLFGKRGVDGRQSDHRRGCEAYQVWGAAGLTREGGEAVFPILALGTANVRGLQS